MEFKVHPVAFVKNSRKEILDDSWAAVISEIELVDGIPAETLDGIEDFSHLELVFIFDKVNEEDIVLKSAHPRENPEWPKVGIFAQRKKSRPNRIGLSIVKLLKKEGNLLTVQYLDAINGTPILDIKPVMEEFLPKSKVKQPDWSAELMKSYW
ncbi:MAG: tRNA (N6-threonylcarbamoyladenosine(37)-N6)-methyltransferase TrmO [Bacteroidia bacterium]